MGLINLNFYSGESVAHESSVMDKTWPTIIGIIIGFGLTRGYEYFKERRAIKRAGEEFINELQLFTEPFEKQITSIDKAIKDIKEPVNRNFILERNIPLDTDRYIMVDRLSVYKYFTKRFKGDTKESRKTVNKLYAILKLCSLEAESLKEHLSIFNKERTEDIIRLNNGINGLWSVYASILLEAEKSNAERSTDKFLLALGPFFKDIEKVNLLTPYEIIPKYINPLVSVCALFRIDPRADRFTEYLRECIASQKDYIADGNNFIVMLEHIKGTLVTQLTEYKAILERPELSL